MPEHTKHNDSLVRFLLGSAFWHIYDLQIYGTGLDTGETIPTVLLFFDQRRFIFNAGEVCIYKTIWYNPMLGSFANSWVLGIISPLKEYLKFMLSNVWSKRLTYTATLCGSLQGTPTNNFSASLFGCFCAHCKVKFLKLRTMPGCIPVVCAHIILLLVLPHSCPISCWRVS